MQRDVSAKSCGEESHCLPTRTVVERHMTMSGLQEVAVIESCSCLSDPELCHRVEEHVIHFPGTPFETSVDVGRCSGPCNSGKVKCISSLRFLVICDIRGRPNFQCPLFYEDKKLRIQLIITYAMVAVLEIVFKNHCQNIFITTKCTVHIYTFG